MKKKHLFSQLQKIKSLPFYIMLCFITSSCGSVLPPTPELKPKENFEPKKEIDFNSLVVFFSEKLKNEEKSTEIKAEIIKSTNLADERQLVWEAWKTANLQNKEEKLPILENLEQEKQYKWNLIDEDPMPFYWGSKGNKPANGYPLFINLHGSGPKATEWSATIGLAKSYEDAPSAYFIPQIPNEKRYRWWYQPEQKAWEKLFRLAFLSENIDLNKIYFMGISEGGYGSQRLAAFYADYLAGAGPMAGGEPLYNAPPLNFRNIAFAFETGENDMGFFRNELTLEAKKEFDSLEKEFPGEFKHQINLQKGRGHSIDYTIVTPWLSKHKRNPHPKRVSWVNYPMHNRYRSGFYNLQVLEPFNVDSETETDRTLFEMEIIGNAIHLQANTLTKGNKEVKQGITTKVEFIKGEITKGKIMLYLSPELIDLNKKVELTVNGKQLFNKQLNLDRKHLINSCAAFGDPLRLYPAGIEIDFKK